MKKIAILLLFVAFTAATIKAQSEMFSMQYSIGFGSGDLHDFISNASYRGANMEYQKLTGNENFGVGFGVGWTAWYQSPGYVTLKNGTEALSGTQYRYLSTVPITFNLNYYLNQGETLNPFVGFGIGTEYSKNDVDMGLYTFREKAWHFLLKPEVGFIFSPKQDVGVIISGKYYHAFKTTDVDERSYFGLNMGIVRTF